MLTELLRRNNFFTLGFCFMLLFALWIPQLFAIAEVPSAAVYQQMQAKSLWMVWLPNSIGWTWVAFLLTVIATSLFFVLNNRHLFHAPDDFLLPLLYVFIASAIPATQWFSGVQVAVLLVFAGVNYLFLAQDCSSGLGELFVAAFCFATASLCFPPALLLLLLLPVGILILRSFAWRDWLMIITGVLTPFIYLFFYYWLTTRDVAFAQTVFRLLLPEASLDLAIRDFPVVAFFVCLAWITLLSLFSSLPKQSVTKVKIARMRTVFVWMLLCIITGAIFYPAYGYQIMPLLALPVTVIIASYFAQPGGRKMKIVCWLLLIAAVVYLHLNVIM